MLLSKNKKIYIRINSHKKILMSEFMYIISFVIYLTNIFFYKTMFRVYMNNQITTLINIICISMLMFKIVMFDKYTVKEFYKIVVLGIIFILAYFSSGYNMLIFLALFIIAAKDVNFKSIIKAYLIIGSSIVIIAMIASKFGIIEHIIYTRNGKNRYAFGSIYATDFAAGIFFLIISYFYIRYERLTIFESIVFFMLGIFTYNYCDARLDSICIFTIAIFSLYTIILRINKKNLNRVKNKNLLTKFLLIIALPVMALSSIFITIIYNPSNLSMSRLNEISNNRLIMGKKGIVDYGFTLFGQKIDMIGNGATNQPVSNYFFIDSSFLHIALRYGLLVLIIICLYYVIFIKKRINEKDMLLPMIILIIGINSIMAHHFIDLAYNPFILVFFAILNKKERSEIIERV